MRFLLRHWAPGVVAILCLVSGCYSKSVEGDRIEYGVSWYATVPVIIVSGFGLLVVALGIGILIFGSGKRPKPGGRATTLGCLFMLLVAGLVIILIAPNVFINRVVVDSEGFEARYGFWFAPSDHSIRFDALHEVQYVPVASSWGRKDRAYELRCIPRSGETVTVAVGEMMSKALPEIIVRAREKGIPVLGVP